MKLFEKKKDDWWEARDAYQAEEDGGERKTYGGWVLAFVIGGLCVYVLYFLQERLYGGAVDTSWRGWRTALFGMMLGILLRDGLGKKPKPFAWKSEKNKKIVQVIFWLVYGLILLVLFSIERKPWILSGQLWLGILLVGCLSLVEKRRGKKLPAQEWACALVFLIVVIPALVLPKAMGFITTKQAEGIVTAEGCTEAEYLGWLYDTWVYQDAQTKPFPEPQEREKQYYMVFGRKDGEPYRFLIDPEGGDIILAAAETEEPGLANWYR